MTARSLSRYHILASLFASLTAVGAFIRIPIPYVPMTLQTFFVILSGTLLGPRYGAMSQLIYLFVGLAGVPVFANGGGPAYVLQPTFGYLLAYPIAAYTIGFLIWGSTVPDTLHVSVRRIMLANSAGLLIIYLVGLTVLYLNLNYVVSKPTSLTQTLWIGFALFIPSSLLKVVVATLLTPRLIGLITLQRQTVS